MEHRTLAQKVEAILASGVTYKIVAERAECDVSTIQRIKTGAIANPRYSVGCAIDSFYAELCTKAA